MFGIPEHRVWGAHEAFPQILGEHIPTSHWNMIAGFFFFGGGDVHKPLYHMFFLSSSFHLSIHPPICEHL